MSKADLSLHSILANGACSGVASRTAQTCYYGVAEQLIHTPWTDRLTAEQVVVTLPRESSNNFHQNLMEFFEATLQQTSEMLETT